MSPHSDARLTGNRAYGALDVLARLRAEQTQPTAGGPSMTDPTQPTGAEHVDTSPAPSTWGTPRPTAAPDPGVLPDPPAAPDPAVPSNVTAEPPPAPQPPAEEQPPA